LQKTSDKTYNLVCVSALAFVFRPTYIERECAKT